MFSMTKFALIGAGGYIAPRHMGAIRDNGGDLLAAFDPNDSVGVLDSYFPKARFFTEFERFDRYVDQVRNAGAAGGIDYVSICSPNYLHDSHIGFALRAGANAICEKPLVLDTRDLDSLIEIEKTSGRTAHTILQLRIHPSIVALRDRIQAENKDSKYEVDLTYITSRGNWYMQSWKGQESKSGGIATNIGVHFFDMLHFVFGPIQSIKVGLSEERKAAGLLEYEKARVRWFLSIDVEDVPEQQASVGQRTYRSITVDGQEIEFSEGFTELHNHSYREILAGRGFGLEDARPSIETVAYIRTAPVSREAAHPRSFGKQQ